MSLLWTPLTTNNQEDPKKLNNTFYISNSKQHPMNFTNLIMKFVTTISFSILINGFLVDSIQPVRGIRQKHLISTYILCAFRNAQDLKVFRGIAIVKKHLI